MGAGHHRMDFVLTWNIKHLAIPAKRVHLAQYACGWGFLSRSL